MSGENVKKKADADASNSAEKPRKESPSITGQIGDAKAIQLGTNRGMGKTRKRSLSITVGKPNKKSWFWICPDPDFKGQFRAIELEPEDAVEKKWYLIDPALHGDLKVEQDTVDINLYTGVTNKGKVFLWPLKLSDTDWTSTALEAIESAQDRIIRMIPDMQSRCYFLEEALEEPTAPNWEEVLDGKSFTDLLNLGFKGKYVADDSHPLFKELWLKD